MTTQCIRPVVIFENDVFDPERSEYLLGSSSFTFDSSWLGNDVVTLGTPCSTRNDGKIAPREDDYQQIRVGLEGDALVHTNTIHLAAGIEGLCRPSDLNRSNRVKRATEVMTWIMGCANEDSPDWPCSWDLGRDLAIPYAKQDGGEPIAMIRELAHSPMPSLRALCSDPSLDPCDLMHPFFVLGSRLMSAHEKMDIHTRVHHTIRTYAAANNWTTHYQLCDPIFL